MSFSEKQPYISTLGGRIFVRDARQRPNKPDTSAALPPQKAKCGAVFTVANRQGPEQNMAESAAPLQKLSTVAKRELKGNYVPKTTGAYRVGGVIEAEGVACIAPHHLRADRTNRTHYAA